jgi:hypothetical protein
LIRKPKRKGKKKRQKRRDQKLRFKQVLKGEISTISPPPFSGLGTGCEQLSTYTGRVK